MLFEMFRRNRAFRLPFPVALLGALSFLSASCNENGPSNTTRVQTGDQLHGDSTPVVAIPPPQPISGSSSGAFVPPADAQYTILAYTLHQPEHVVEVNNLKEYLIGVTKRNEWYAIHSADESNLYFGYYRSTDPRDPAGAMAQADLAMIKPIEIKDTEGQPRQPFADNHCAFVPLAAPDPEAPPEWNLVNKDLQKAARDPSRAYWSLQIMAFRANSKRKAAALQAVATLRKKGVEAYYYHGETVSSVCVGAWPRNAIREQQYHAGGNVGNPNQDLVVYTENLGNVNVPSINPEDGNQVVAVAPKVDIDDLSLKEMLRQYPFHAVNYEIPIDRDRNGGIHEAPSLIVVIPRARGNGYYDSTDVAPDVANVSGTKPLGGLDSTFPPVQEAQTPGEKRLRHLGPN